MPDVFWAAFGGGAAAGVFTLLALAFAEWLRRFLDRPLVKCELTVGLMLQDSQSTETVFFIARNPHSKSVTLSGCGLTYKRKEWGILTVSPHWFPHQLDRGKSFTARVPTEELLDTSRNSGRAPADIKEIYFNTESDGQFRNKVAKGYIKQFEKKFDETNQS